MVGRFKYGDRDSAQENRSRCIINVNKGYKTIRKDFLPNYSHEMQVLYEGVIF